MLTKCEKCNNCFEITGNKVLELLTGGTECPACKGNINIIIKQNNKPYKKLESCPYCKDKNIAQFLTFKQCLNCKKTFDTTNQKEAKQ